jgi:hypothetical protein
MFEEAQTKCVLAAELIRKYGKLRLRVTGLSMLPAVWPGDIVTIQRREPSALLPGDIVLVECQGCLRLHRFIATREDRHIITRGDSLPDDDPPVLPEEVLGILTSIQRRGSVFSPRKRPSRFACLFSGSPRLSAWLIRIAFRLRRLLGPTPPRETPTLVP